MKEGYRAIETKVKNWIANWENRRNMARFARPDALMTTTTSDPKLRKSSAVTAMAEILDADTGILRGPQSARWSSDLRKAYEAYVRGFPSSGRRDEDLHRKRT
jgi:hypothetical protein